MNKNMSNQTTATMKKMKIVDGFFTKAEANRIASYHRSVLRLQQDGKTGSKVSIVNAAAFIRENSLEDKYGRPNSVRLMVVITYYDAPQASISTETITIPLVGKQHKASARRIEAATLLPLKSRPECGAVFSAIGLMQRTGRTITLVSPKTLIQDMLTPAA